MICSKILAWNRSRHKLCDLGQVSYRRGDSYSCETKIIRAYTAR